MISPKWIVTGREKEATVSASAPEKSHPPDHCFVNVVDRLTRRKEKHKKIHNVDSSSNQLDHQSATRTSDKTETVLRRNNGWIKRRSIPFFGPVAGIIVNRSKTKLNAREHEREEEKTQWKRSFSLFSPSFLLKTSAQRQARNEHSFCLETLDQEQERDGERTSAQVVNTMQTVCCTSNHAQSRTLRQGDSTMFFFSHFVEEMFSFFSSAALPNGHLSFHCMIPYCCSNRTKVVTPFKKKQSSRIHAHSA